MSAMPTSRPARIPPLAIFVIRASLILSALGVVVMALGLWLNFTSDNPVFKAVYICIDLSFAAGGLLMTSLINQDDD